jgi:hypothetical protein
MKVKMTRKPKTLYLDGRGTVNPHRGSKHSYVAEYMGHTVEIRWNDSYHNGLRGRGFYSFRGCPELEGYAHYIRHTPVRNVSKTLKPMKTIFQRFVDALKEAEE